MKKNKRLVFRPKEYQSKDGYNFYLEDSAWRLNKDIELNLTWTSTLNLETYGAYLSVLAYYAENHSADHTKNMNVLFKRYIEQTDSRGILSDSLISYRSTLSKEQEHYLGALKGFLRKWHELGYPGISDEVIKLLKGWRLKGNEKGRAIALLDPNSGPFTDIEMSALLDGLLDKYMDAGLCLSDYALISILAHSGRRAVQITSLKIKDIIRKTNGDIHEYIINFPRAKQRDSSWRDEFNTYPITEDLWLLLDLHIKNVIDRIQSFTALQLNSNTIGNLPLFPNYDSLQKGLDEKTLNDELQFDSHHVKRNACNQVLKKAVSTLGVYSERTGLPLKLTSKRFRYTLGTNLAREGKGEYILAEALDHSDTQNVGVYVRNIPDIVEHIDKAVAYKLAPLAQSFQGVLIDSEKDAIRGDDINSRIGNGKENLGSCGSYGFCGAMAPISCYTCTHFQPWLYGPHEMILDELIEKRDEILSITKDLKMAAVNDRLILAVSDVVLHCSLRKKKMNKKELNNG